MHIPKYSYTKPLFAMKFIRLLHQMKSAKIIKPNEIVYMEDLENILLSKKNDPK